jgi:uncharacterized protein
MTESSRNRLAHETSPYLLQHAGNPVDWYPWANEALEAARAADKPIFLSVGYSSCHWCHVMEHESFEDPETAALLNELFVSIKVDREERPDLDEVYMQAVQLFTGGHGGWPMSVFLTPDLRPYFGGTYFPPTDRHGLPGFRTVLRFAAEIYRDRRADVEQTGNQVVEALRQLAAVAPAPESPGREVLDAAYGAFLRGFDAENGGFGGAPKFPPAMGLSYLLRVHSRGEAPDALPMVRRTLDRMSRGGIHDQLAGGFHRYATDAHWLVPHFEKMLYDNALLARAYLEGWQASGEPAYRDVTHGILEYVAREMTSPEGGFYSAQDADSEGVEGKYFAWTPEQIRAVAGEADARVACRYWDVTERGNFEHGASVLSVPRDPDVVASELGLELDDLRVCIDRVRAVLLVERGRRVPPARDDKIIVAWNGLMIAAMARAAAAFGDPELLRRASRAARFILERTGDGPLFRTCKEGRTRGVGYLDDHAAMVSALLDLYEATFEPSWMDAALRLDDVLQAEFWDGEQGGYFYAGERHETLLARSRQPFDNATPSGNSIEVGNLLRIAALTGDDERRQRAERTLGLFALAMQQFPVGMAEMLCALDLQLGPILQVAIAGGGPGAGALERALQSVWVPRKVVAGWADSGETAPLALLAGREPVDGRPAAYVCREFTCLRPITDPGELEAALREARVPGPGPG